MPATRYLENTVSGERYPLSLMAPRVLVGRATDADIRVLDQSCSRQQFAVHCLASGFELEPLSANVVTLVNGVHAESRVALENGTQVRFATQVWRFVDTSGTVRSPQETRRDGPTDTEQTHRGFSTPAPSTAPPMPVERNDATSPPTEDPFGVDSAENTQAYFDPGLSAPVKIEVHSIDVSGGGVIGRLEGSSFRLDHPMVSRRHAEVQVKGSALSIRDLGSANGTFIDGSRIQGWTALQSGNRIDIGPFSLTVLDRTLQVESRRGNLRIVAHALTRDVPHRDQPGEMLRILDNVSITIPPREFVAIVGPSGSGKTTLMNALSAREPAQSGQVIVNGVDLYRNFESLKESISMVPQEEALHDSLVVSDAVTYTARMRLPSDTETAAIQRAVQGAIGASSLSEAHARQEVRSLSGGQRKRASLANETVHDPSLLFVDEVTSGLDEETDAQIMALLRASSESGRTVVCVTHTLANVDEYCHKVVIMAVPGVLAFYGTPAECLTYFGIKRLSDVYKILNDSDGHELARRYQASESFARHVGDTAGDAKAAESSSMVFSQIGKSFRQQAPEILRQLRVLTSRANRLLFSDRKVLRIAAGQCIAIGLILALVYMGLDGVVPGPDGTGWIPAAAEKFFGENFGKQKSLLFMLGISCFWFGTSNASKEIVKERVIYRRERDVNLQIPAYILAKLPGLAALGLAQAGILFLIVMACCGIPGTDLYVLVIMMASVIAGSALGLLVSAVSETPDQATTLVPIALIPQIVMSGVIVPQMPALADFVANLLVAGKWIVDALVPTQIPGSPAWEYPGFSAVLGSLVILFLHFAFYLGAALVVMNVRDSRGGATYGDGLKKWVAGAGSRLRGRGAGAR